ncbi:MAG TPA: pectin acetylesterase-family hydrolase [Kofleriaceae bacterium]|nr:pectin acetylesterase-family hydrolase [Kofleriaceae bacterium]
MKRALCSVLLTACAVDAQTTETESPVVLSSSFEAVKPALRDTQWRDARCNDGTPFGFYVRRSPPSTDWVIYFEGGGFCDDNAHPCDQRAATRPELITTIPEADGTLTTLPVGGLVSTDPAANDFAGANLVYAHYCSSDFWAGNTDGRIATTGGDWFGKGHRNVEAMLGMLAAQYGLDDADPATRVLVAGGSSGGFAVHLNASRVEAALPATSAAHRVKLVVDAGWFHAWNWDVVKLTYPDTTSHYFADAIGPDRGMSAQFRQFWNATYDPACEASAPAPADCLFGGYWYPVLRKRLPILVQQSNADSAFALGEHALVDGSSQMSAWRSQLSSSQQSVDWLFSGSKPYHTLTGSNAGLTVGPPGASLRTVIWSFWTGQPAQRVVF